MEIVLELGKLTIIGLIAGLFSFWLTNKRKWWELKVTAYQSVIEALSDLVHFHQCCWDNLTHNKHELSDELREQRDKANTKIKKLANTGAFLFSPQATLALKKLLDDQENTEQKYGYDSSTKVEFFDANSSNSKKCLDTFIECSKKDLNLIKILKW